MDHASLSQDARYLTSVRGPYSSRRGESCPQAPDHALSITEKLNLAFPVLSDLDQAVVGAYRVQFTLTGDLEDLQVNVFQNDPREQNADHTRSLPVPATFVIDRRGIVRAAFVSADWRYRPEPADIIAVLEALQ
jgi:peroxiredoxin